MFEDDATTSTGEDYDREKSNSTDAARKKKQGKNKKKNLQNFLLDKGDDEANATEKRLNKKGSKCRTIIHADTCLTDSIYHGKFTDYVVGKIFHYRVISSYSKTDTCTLWYKNRMIDSEVGTSWTKYIEESREETDMM